MSNLVPKGMLGPTFHLKMDIFLEIFPNELNTFPQLLAKKLLNKSFYSLKPQSTTPPLTEH